MYKLIQYKDKDIGQFNREVNELLKDGWKLEGEYRITKVKNKLEPSYLVYSQVLTKEEEKKAMGFNVHLLEEKVEKKEKKKKNT
jgi:hypothetical protein